MGPKLPTSSPCPHGFLPSNCLSCSSMSRGQLARPLFPDFELEQQARKTVVNHSSDPQSSPRLGLHGSEKSTPAPLHRSCREREELRAQQFNVTPAPFYTPEAKPNINSNRQNPSTTNTNSHTADHSLTSPSRPSTTDPHTQSHPMERTVLTFTIPSYPNHQVPIKRSYNPPQSPLITSDSYSMNRMLDESPPPTTLFVVPGCEQKAALRNRMHRHALKTRMRVLEERIGVF